MTRSLSRDLSPALDSTAYFSVAALSDPATLPRVLGVFAKLGRVPSQCHALSLGDGSEELHIDLQFTDMQQSEGEHLAQTLRGCFLVTSVLTSQKRTRLIA